MLLLLLMPNIGNAEQCEDIGLYAFISVGCPQQKLGVDIRIPLCQQPQWQHLSYMDYRCREKINPATLPVCYDWDCPVPYNDYYRDVITGDVKEVVGGDRVEVDNYFRACRQSLGQVNREVKRLKARKRR